MADSDETPRPRGLFAVGKPIREIKTTLLKAKKKRDRETLVRLLLLGADRKLPSKKSRRTAAWRTDKSLIDFVSLTRKKVCEDHGKHLPDKKLAAFILDSANPIKKTLKYPPSIRTLINWLSLLTQNRLLTGRHHKSKNHNK